MTTTNGDHDAATQTDVRIPGEAAVNFHRDAEGKIVVESITFTPELGGFYVWTGEAVDFDEGSEFWLAVNDALGDPNENQSDDSRFCNLAWTE